MFAESGVGARRGRRTRRQPGAGRGSHRRALPRACPAALWFRCISGADIEHGAGLGSSGHILVTDACGFPGTDRHGRASVRRESGFHLDTCGLHGRGRMDVTGIRVPPPEPASQAWVFQAHRILMGSCSPLAPTEHRVSSTAAERRSRNQASQIASFEPRWPDPTGGGAMPIPDSRISTGDRHLGTIVAFGGPRATPSFRDSGWPS